MFLNHSEIQDAYTTMKTALTRLHLALTEQQLAKSSFEMAKSVAIMSGRIVGRNSDERDANTMQLLQNEVSMVFESNQAVEQAKNGVALAQLEIDRIRVLLQFYNIENSLNLLTTTVK